MNNIIIHLSQPRSEVFALKSLHFGRGKGLEIIHFNKNLVKIY